MDRLHAMRIFVTVLEKQSLSTAAASLNLSLPSVSRVLGRLERELGTRLVARNTRSLRETDAGKLYYQHCKRILKDLSEAEAAIQSHSKAPAGELRITAPVTFGLRHVSPHVAEFLERYPRLSCHLSLSDHCEPLNDRQFDVAIRVAVLREERFSARRLGYTQRAVVGSAEYFQRREIPRHPRDLIRHNCLHFTHYLRADEWNFIEQGHPVSVRVRGRFRASNQEALLEAVLAGAGLAVLPTWLVADSLASGRLRRVLSEFEAPRTPVSAVFPGRGVPPSKVRAFVDFLAARYQSAGTLAPHASNISASRGRP